MSTLLLVLQFLMEKTQYHVGNGFPVSASAQAGSGEGAAREEGGFGKSKVHKEREEYRQGRTPEKDKDHPSSTPQSTAALCLPSPIPILPKGLASRFQGRE